MKQRITVEQLNELTDKQKERLREWWAPSLGDWVLNNFNQEHLVQFDGEYGLVAYGDRIDTMGGYDEVKIKCLPLLSIGQMIEFFQGTNSDWTIRGSEWGESDICDTLWSNLKYYL